MEKKSRWRRKDDWEKELRNKLERMFLFGEPFHLYQWIGKKLEEYYEQGVRDEDLRWHETNNLIGRKHD